MAIYKDVRLITGLVPTYAFAFLPAPHFSAISARRSTRWHGVVIALLALLALLLDGHIHCSMNSL
jgi:hypothetical protein